MAANRYLSDKNETLVVRFLVIIVAYFLLRSIIKRANKQAAQDAVATGDANALIAVEMRQSMNPSGTAWLMDFDGTETEALFNAARKATNFNAVASSYASLYDADLISDVQNELSVSEFAQFQTLLGKGGAKGRYYASKNNVPAYELENWETSPKIIDTPVYKMFTFGEIIDFDFVQKIAGTQGNVYAVFVNSRFLLSDTYVAINVKDLIIQ